MSCTDFLLNLSKPPIKFRTGERANSESGDRAAASGAGLSESQDGRQQPGDATDAAAAGQIGGAREQECGERER